MEPATAISLATLAVSFVGGFFLYKQTSLAWLKEELETLRQKHEECEQEVRKLRSENRWLSERLRRLEEASNWGAPSRKKLDDGS